MNCPCGLQRAYPDCCGRYHAGIPAPSPEALMRSRYSAYVLKDGPYLLATWHDSTRPTSLDLAGDHAKWFQLEVKSIYNNLQKNEHTAAHGTVEFVARYKIGGRAFRLHETSRFVFEAGHWFYVGGDLMETAK